MSDASLRRPVIFRVWVVRYWRTYGVFESHAIKAWDGRTSEYVYLTDPEGERNRLYPFLRRGQDVVDTKDEVMPLIKKLAAKKLRSLDKQKKKIQELAKDPWRKT